jgi:hypothetical protein
MPPRVAVLGFAADLAFILLIVAGILTMIMSPHVEKSISQGQRIGSLIADVGTFGLHAIACFVIIPALAFDIWRKNHADLESELTVADCGGIYLPLFFGFSYVYEPYDPLN